MRALHAGYATTTHVTVGERHSVGTLCGNATIWERKPFGTLLLGTPLFDTLLFGTLLFGTLLFGTLPFGTPDLMRGRSAIAAAPVCLLAVRLAAICIGIEAEGKFEENPDSAGRSQPILGLCSQPILGL